MIPRQIIVDMVDSDTAPELHVRFQGLDLGDYSEIKMNVLKSSGIRYRRDVVPDPSDPELGIVTWISGDLVKGRHEAEFQLTRTDGKVLTLPRKHPVILNVRGELG